MIKWIAENHKEIGFFLLALWNATQQFYLVIHGKKLKAMNGNGL